MLKLTGIQTGYDGDEEKIEFMTEAKLYEKEGAFYLRYEESEISGMPGCTTTLRYNENGLKMRRSGEELGHYTVIEFDKGKRYTSLYQTPFGAIEMEVQTSRYEHELAADGTGSIQIDYEVAMAGIGELRNSLNIEILEQ